MEDHGSIKSHEATYVLCSTLLPYASTFQCKEHQRLGFNPMGTWFTSLPSLYRIDPE